MLGYVYSIVPFQVRNRVPPNLFHFMNAAIREEVWVPSQECGKYTSVKSKKIKNNKSKNVLEIDVEKDGGIFFLIKIF